MSEKKTVFDYSVFQYIKDIFYDDKKAKIKGWIEANLHKGKIITTTDSISDSIEENLGITNLILGDLLDIEPVNSPNSEKLSNDDSIIKFFTIKRFKNNFNYIFISNNSSVREKVKSFGFETYSISEFEKQY